MYKETTELLFVFNTLVFKSAVRNTCTSALVVTQHNCMSCGRTGVTSLSFYGHDKSHWYWATLQWYDPYRSKIV